MSRKSIRIPIAAVAAFASCVMIEPDVTRWSSESGLVSEADARVGRPRTPVSVAGTARRTTRHVVRRSTIFIAALPGNCSTVVINGASYYQCGVTYYQPYQGQYIVVYID